MGLQSGLTARISAEVTEADTAHALGSGDVQVLGTPRVVALLEAAAVEAVCGELQAGDTTVGTHIAIDHLAATPVGGSVTAEATLTSIEGRRLTFDVNLKAGDMIAARGGHTRVIVDRETFLSRLR
jgi:fluoroacetyl-CoA thioesterase